jgi:hypothetical protein
VDTKLKVLGDINGRRIFDLEEGEGEVNPAEALSSSFIGHQVGCSFREGEERVETRIQARARESVEGGGVIH